MCASEDNKKQPSMGDLGYGITTKATGKVPTAADLGYGDDDNDLPSVVGGSRFKGGGIAAKQIPSGKRISPLLGLGGGGYGSSHHSRGTLVSLDELDDEDSFCDDDSDYTGSLDDLEDDRHNHNHKKEKGDLMQDLTDLTQDDDKDNEDDWQDLSDPNLLPSKVDIEFEGNSKTPRRISLNFSQSYTEINNNATAVEHNNNNDLNYYDDDDDDGRIPATSTRSSGGRLVRSRSGRLGVSIGTSRLPRRRASINNFNQSWTEGETGDSIIRRGLEHNQSNLSVSTRPMQRLSIEHTNSVQRKRLPSRSVSFRGEKNNATSSSSSRPTIQRRITMNLSSVPRGRRGSLGMSDHSRQATVSGGGGGATCDPLSSGGSQHSSGLARRRNSLSRRKSMDYTTPTVPLSCEATRRISMDMSSFESPETADNAQGGGGEAAAPRRRTSMNLTTSQLPRERPNKPPVPEVETFKLKKRMYRRGSAASVGRVTALPHQQDKRRGSYVT